MTQPEHQVERYDKLPDVLKGLYTREQYAWLSDREKDEIVDNNTMPDADAEDLA